MSERAGWALWLVMLLAGCRPQRVISCGPVTHDLPDYRGRAELLEKWPPVRFETQHGDERCRAIWRAAFYGCSAEWELTHHGVVVNPGTDDGVAFAECGEVVRVCGVQLVCECMRPRSSERPWEDWPSGPRATEHY